ncbi:uncharacterized protein LOC114315312 [Camellia sinensis]|uniref:uncharacterized protein LOC114315312 n=1 Tax=Camellia sinensis TaxID=4442 RepID=UPI0010363798|nr:uncharacterized protein LOC114315312 [Camellia sinensis]
MMRTRGDELDESTSNRLDPMEIMMHDMAESLRQQQQWKQQQQPLPLLMLVPPVLDHQNENRTITLTKEFKKMKPPLFHRGIDLQKAEAWVFGIEKLFEVFLCTKTQKVLLAAFTLKDKARRWWMLVRDTNKGINWVQFLEIFYEKYFPQRIRDRKVTEFEQLNQQNKSVAEYEAQFTELALFTPYMVDTDYKKARKFERGLRDAILDRINVLKLPKYIDVLDKVLMAETNLANRN